MKAIKCHPYRTESLFQESSRMQIYKFFVTSVSNSKRGGAAKKCLGGPIFTISMSHREHRVLSHKFTF